MKDNEDINGEPFETEDKAEAEPVQRPRKTSKFMTKYERARILGTRALQIRSASSLFLCCYVFFHKYMIICSVSYCCYLVRFFFSLTLHLIS